MECMKIIHSVFRDIATQQIEIYRTDLYNIWEYGIPCYFIIMPRPLSKFTTSGKENAAPFNLQFEISTA